MTKNAIHSFAIATLGLALAGAAHAGPVHVGVMNGGGFGGVNGNANTAQQGILSSTLGFVNSGFQVQAGDKVQVTASGTLCLSGNAGCGDANGQVMQGLGNGTAHFTGLNNLFGALVGSIVGDDSGNFQAFDAADVANGISQSSLFALGTNVQFTATRSGRLYLGVSDSAFWDNAGAGFEVTLSRIPSGNQVPEPSSWALAGLALFAAFAARRRGA
ncbi:PEP-CTERM sorting domain-containing protein [Paucibacter sp. B51]|uniref:PEP-CTERM sorting domain-containing protein n=1 Tax=Paucibacter sp. B51 TaxID=2993315 RepID=UPI0022EBFC26|nr:PEP-CTERM sorting domain-containing protein [Paucibacter sp. B51]